MTRTVPLTRGMFATVGAFDFRQVMKHKWHAFQNHDRGWYARAKIDGNRIFMHNFIFGSKFTDHRDGNGLNNTRGNLRAASHSQNAQNRTVKRSGTSRYKGVYLLKTGVYRAIIQGNGLKVSLGCFPNESDAAMAYDSAAKELYGEFASLNFPSKEVILPTCDAPWACPIHGAEK